MAPPPALSRFIACWGNGQHGRLGHGGARNASELFPRVVAALASAGNAARVACGGAHTAAVMGARGVGWSLSCMLGR